MRTITLTDQQSEWVHRTLVSYACDSMKYGDKYKWVVDLCFALTDKFEVKELSNITFKTFDEETTDDETNIKTRYA